MRQMTRNEAWDWLDRTYPEFAGFTDWVKGGLAEELSVDGIARFTYNRAELSLREFATNRCDQHQAWGVER